MNSNPVSSPSSTSPASTSRGDPPTKEALLHRSVYDVRPKDGAIVHLHCTHAVAISCLDPSCHHNKETTLPPITPYFVMRVGKLPLVPYFKPGDPKLADAIRDYAKGHRAVLLANHGPVVAGTSLSAASASIEELEETAKLHLLLQGFKVRLLSDAQVREVEEAFRRDPNAATPRCHPERSEGPFLRPQRPLASLGVTALPGTEPMPKLAANLSWIYQEVPFLQRFGAAAQHGFKAVEILFPYEAPAADIAAELKKHKLTQALFNLPAGDASKGERGFWRRAELRPL